MYTLHIYDAESMFSFHMSDSVMLYQVAQAYRALGKTIHLSQRPTEQHTEEIETGDLTKSAFIPVNHY